MKRFVAVAVVIGALAALSGCATPCCYCYCGDVPTRELVAVDAPRPEIAPQHVNPVVVARY
jgi:hypothetical protein